MVLGLGGKGAGPWPSIPTFYAQRVIAGIEHVEGQTYTRTVAIDDGAVLMSLSQSIPEAIDVVLHGANVAHLFGLATRIRRALDLDTDVVAVSNALRADEVLRPVVGRYAGLRLPGAWDSFELAVRALLGQQISVKAARTLASRIVARYGQPMTNAGDARSITHVFPGPHALAKADVADFVALGLTKARARSLVGLVKAAAGDPELFSPARSLDALIERLCALEGIGAWTAHYIALRAFGEADAFPASDLGLRKAYGALSGTVPSAVELERIAAKWSPWRGYAAQYLWTHLGAREGEETTDELAA